MDDTLQTMAELLALRYSALCTLGKEIEAGQQAFVDMDIEQIEQHTSRQADLCAKIIAMNEEVSSKAAWTRQAMGSSEAEFEPLKDLIRQNESAQLKVADAAEAFEDFLRSSRANLNILLNVNRYLLGTYSLTKDVPVPDPFFERSC
jgi:hypothetical protein